MPKYPNGQIPEHELHIFNRGRTVHQLKGGGTLVEDWYQGLTPGTYAKHVALVARALKNTGKRLQLSAGFSCYRPLYGQTIARTLYGNGAATVGTSSHGGYWERQDTLAMDYGNWSYVYNGDRGRFYADCRAVGLTPGMISRERGYPDEPWHVIDLEPWRAVTAGIGAVPFSPPEPEPNPPYLEDFMITVTCPTLLNGWIFLLGVGYIKNAPGDQGHNYAHLTTGKVHTLTNDEMIAEMWNHGLQECFPTSGTAAELQAFLHSLGGGRFYVASWLRTSSPAVTVSLSDDDKAQIAARVRDGLSLPTPEQIAQAVNDDAADRMQS
jgi:hypothetical protein